MSSEKATLETRAKSKLATLVNEIDKVVKTALEDMSPDEISYLYTKYENQLRYDLKRDFSEAREAALKESPFDDYFNE